MKKAYLYAAVSIFGWSTVATVTKFLLDSLDSIQLLWISSAFAGLALLVANIVSSNIKKLKEYSPKDIITIILIGLPGTFFYYIFYYSGADMMPASQAFIINYMWPIMCVVFACIILKEKLTAKKMISVLISFVGVGIITGKEIVQFEKNIVLGACLCLAGAVCYGAFTALNRKYVYERRIAMMINYFVTFVLTTVINLCRGTLFVPETAELAGFAWNGIFSVAISCICWIYALEGGNTAVIANLAYITPFLSLIWTSVFLNEEITVVAVVGLSVIVAGILGQFIRLPKKKRSFSENWAFKDERGNKI